MTSTNVKVTGSFSPFIRVTTDVFITDNSTVVFYHLTICIEDLAFDDKLTIILKENNRPDETETTFYPSKLGPRT